MSTGESNYVERRNGGYYIAGSSVSLASVIHSFRQGSSAETILEEFPAIGSLVKVYGAITFVLENPSVVEVYLTDQERSWVELEKTQPLPREMRDRFEKGREVL